MSAHPTEHCNKPELFGNKTVSASAVFAHLSFVRDDGCVDESLLESDTIEEQCRRIERDRRVAKASCAPIYFSDGSVYVEINIIEHVLRGRTATEPRPPKRLVEPLPDELVAAYRSHVEAWFAAFRENAPHGEYVKDGVIHYGHPGLQEHVAQLTLLAKANKGRLLQNLMHAESIDDRIASAWLLGWVGLNETDIGYTLDAALDESVNVRNNYSRSVIFFADYVRDPETTKRLVSVILMQLALPSHADRNKALFVLRSLIEHNEIARAMLRQEEASQLLQDVASRSSLDNVGGTADEILIALEHPHE